MGVGFQRVERTAEHPAQHGLARYTVAVEGEPRRQWWMLEGPGVTLRLAREDSPDFFSFAELAKDLVGPGMSDLERAMAIYRFSARHFHKASMGWGATEMTRFINAFGYSYCWGQADFQHLLYEAAGLQARAPHLKGHSSVEVLIDGKWRLMDAFMRLLVPAPDLSGLATGSEASGQLELFDAVREGERLVNARDWWSQHAPGGTYEPWQDTSAMLLTLRRGESLRFDFGRRERWCMAPTEPQDYCNGAWRWRALLDGTHLEKEAEQAVNVSAVAGGLAAESAGRPAQVDYQIRSPWPLVCGTLLARLDRSTPVTVQVFDPRRREWKPVFTGETGQARVMLDEHLSPPTLPASRDVHLCDARPVYELAVRLTWQGPAVLNELDWSFLVQAHGPSLPRLTAGENRWRLLGQQGGMTMRHGWTCFPGLAVSNDRPYVGETVTLTATVHNTGDRPALNVPVRFVQQGTGLLLGEAVIARIEPGGSAQAAAAWTARIDGDRPALGEKPCYVSTVIVAEVEGGGQEADLSTEAEMELVVLALPVPRFGPRLVWSGPAEGGQGLVLRAAVAHDQREMDLGLLYLQEAACTVTLTPYGGDPDQGGQPLAPAQVLRDIGASEFAVAEWRLPQAALAEAQAIWVEMTAEAPVASEHRRQVVRHELTVHSPVGAAGA